MIPRPFLLLPTIVLIVACSAPAIPTGSPASIEGDWVLVAGADHGKPMRLRDDARITLQVSGERMSGTSACNHYGAVLGPQGGLGIEGTTAMACEPDVMALEDEYLNALSRVTDFRIVDERLVLTGGGAELVFAPVLTVDLGTIRDRSWRLAEVIRGGVASRPLGPPARFSLNADGTFAGSTGCRDLHGRYSVVGDEIEMFELSAEGPECPPALAEQDSHVVSVIGDGFRAVVGVDGRLTIFDSTREALVYEPDRGTG